VGCAFVDDFHPVGFMFVIEQADLLTDKLGRRFKEPIVDRNGTVFRDPAPNLLAKMVFNVSRGGPDQLDVVTKADEWRLTGAGMTALMVVFAHPQIQGDIDIVQGTAKKRRQKL
jgi:hypothetical protein